MEGPTGTSDGRRVGLFVVNIVWCDLLSHNNKKEEVL